MRPHLMIVDDTNDQIILMQAIFNRVDPSIKIITASDGDEALNILKTDQKFHPKVILLDLKMPKKNGLEVLSVIKADAKLRTIPVYIFSNGDLEDDICESYKRGASFYFKKPSGLSELRKFAEIIKSVSFELASLC